MWKVTFGAPKKLSTSMSASSFADRGHEYRVCNKRCGEALQKDPDKLLGKDGTVKAEKMK